MGGDILLREVQGGFKNKWSFWWGVIYSGTELAARTSQPIDIIFAKTGIQTLVLRTV